MPTLLSPAAASKWTDNQQTLQEVVEKDAQEMRMVEQMTTLVAIDNQLAHCHASRPVTQDEVERTIAWLQQHQDKKSTDFIHTLLHWIKDRDDENGESPASLPLTWATTTLSFSWEERSFGVLNAPLIVDMLHARRLLLSGGLLHASEADKIEFSKWFEEFLDHLTFCDVLKQRLLHDKGQMTNKAIKVATQYHRVQKCYDESLWVPTGAPYSDKVLECMDEAERVLRDEEKAVAEANLVVMTPSLETEAFSNLFTHIRADAEEGTFVAKLVAWMQHALPDDDFEAIYSFFQHDVKASLAGEWIQEYAEHMHRLDPFDVDFHYSVVYPRSRADIVDSAAALCN
ncbi:hypothetical protein H310_02414 [Aphanomyces invadans]|uniref:Uncharacterized protein n=1 Tax=Aphanomyces invadans TaxID=157072 RepID=A0A024UR06_9STRA|nr:hypothetical protein H310_02414 [Aphanomyces invadans]ETW08043.1 hypothetical protein H310_02414 [Aphanomyces invadans]RHY29695.1 hypothetical protein DYB32_004940 [Aphanomyces invadans]|eukprot:XP_008864136.1 hypothetical protein H310_02414 [Aphanomyces invadans]